jgi:hypothetical protein
MKTKRLAVFAATGLSIAFSSIAFAAGAGGGTAAPDNTTGGTATGNMSAGAGAATNGTPTTRMGSERATNSNGMNATDRDKGLSRAEDRSATQSGVGGVQSGDTDAHGRSSTMKRHHHIGKSPKAAPDDSSTQEGGK